MGWHHARGVRKGLLGLSWRHDNGSAIFQGRPDPLRPKYFVYQLERPDGTTQDFALLAAAKDAGALPATTSRTIP